MTHLKAGPGAGHSGSARSAITDVTFLIRALCLTVLLVTLGSVSSEAASPLMHNSENTASGKYGTWGASYTCATCHSKGPTPNIKKVSPSIPTSIGSRPVIFDRITSSRNDVTGVFGNDERTVYRQGSRNVCEVCHHRTIYHNYSASKLSSSTHAEHKSNRRDCMKCHSHKLGFRPPKAGSCTDCHGDPPLTPAELSSNIYGSYPPADAGAHRQHRGDLRMACASCHNNYGHGLLGNDVIEFGFKIYSSTWPPFTGVISGGTITVTPYPDFNNDVVLAPGNPGTSLIKQPPVAEKHEVVTCSVYCHGDNWAIPSGRAPVEPISWTNGPLGDCSNAVCHGTTPANPPTPSVATGAHGKHVGNLEYSCTKCHDDYPNPHMVNGHVKWNLSALSPAATYRGFNIHSTTTLATTEAYGDCSNVYCHSNVQSGANGTGGATVYSTVRWGGGLLNCDGCHGGKKSDAAPIDSGNHGKHISTYAYDCADCHTNSGSDLPAKHGNQNIEVAMPASYGGSYDQEVNPPANGYGSCSANYCHSDGNGTTKSATWGGTLSCLGCHGGDAASGTPVVTGAHRQHVDNARIGSNYGCAECHANTVSGNETISSTALHVNKLRDYSGAKAGRDRAACNNAYCHSDGKGTPGIAVSWTSGPALTNCIGCHGADSAPTFASAAGEPNYANTGADTLKANNHQRHMGGVGSETCVYCHSSTVTSAGTIIAGSSTHTNSIREVRAGGGKTFDYELATKTCSNISCHGGPAPIKWGATLPVDCTGCHGGNLTSATPQTTGKHAAHMNNAAVLGTNYACVVCHALTVSDDRTIADPAFHGNGFKNYTGRLAGGRGSYTTATGVCSAAYCHSDGKGTQNVPFDAANGWKSAAALDCKGCHGNSSGSDFVSVAGEPNYASTGAGTPRANSHRNHVDDGVATCVYCHGTTVTGAGGIISESTTHILNRSIDVVAGGGKTFTYAAGKTCSNISCHGGKGSYDQVWGAPVSADCTGCHGNNAASSAPIASGKHAAHINNPGLGVNYNCAECHAKTINADERTFADRSLHGNGFFNYSGTRAGSYAAAAGGCSASYCHTDGKGRQNVAFTAANGWNSSATMGCKGCHGNDPVFGHNTSVAGEPNYPNAGAGQPRANSHQRHMGGVGAGTCVYCHSNVVNPAGTLISGDLHTNRLIEVAPGGGKTFTWGADKTCSNINCHGTGSSPAQWGQSFPSDCTGCHGNNIASANPMASGKHAVHINNKSVLGSNYSCNVCHALTSNPDDRSIYDTSVHGNGFKNYTGGLAGSRNSYTLATGVCSASYCHSDGKGQQNVPFDAGNGWKSAATLDCKGCHGNSTAADFVSNAGEPNYASTGSGTARANSHRNHVDSGAASCVYCHGTTVTGEGAIIQDSATHILNRSIDVVAGGGKTFTWAADKTCSNISCHGGVGSYTQTWGASVSADCTGCHGNNASSSGVISSGKHTAHVNNPDLGGNFNCSECHAKTINSDERTFSSRDLHGNGFINYSGTRAGSHAPAAGGCSASYCHTDGKGQQNVAFTAANGWNSAVTYTNCIGCHGNDPAPAFAGVAGEPNYASAGGNVLRSNSHRSHTTAGASTCDTCHNATVTAAGTAIKPGSLHLDRNIDVNFNSAKATATWNQLSRTCNNISCHSGSSAVWGDASSAGCKVCHGNLSAAHSKHIGNLISSDAVTFYNFTAIRSSGQGIRIGCANCHPTDSAKHRNGTVDLSINRGKSGGSYLNSLNLASADGINIASSGITGTSGSNVSCALSYCHSNGKSTALTAGDFKASPNWYGPAPANRCGMCHDNPPQYAGQSHYVAASSLGDDGRPPYMDAGHMVGIHFDNVYKGDGANGFLGYSSGGDKAHGNPAVATTIGCYICHSGVVSSTQIDTYAMHGTGSRYSCSNCHNASTRTPLQPGLITDTARHINGKKDVAFPSLTFKTKAQLSNVANALGWSRNGSYKNAGSYDSMNLGTSTWDPATKTCLTACHVNQPNITWGASLRCFSCHANQ
ncbi:CxxxxCH/CxxCH domain-containing protein [Geobacter sp. DSM 9736]|uniref:CxxxxCH/CxxCH domain c-type cytochrome n=1 Tax=Geobacter sp. DSM 9736 TaxID=1277350 RepID=UPI000B4FE171|nr:CxxxxCH/CxxCH domain-containing protein [Geobacter sp. DSM 9736]SNB46000.1 Geobacter sulfurreducens CxxxxCH...CXXCH domain-containing protein [Geobacter sp. DSM 9736]